MRTASSPVHARHRTLWWRSSRLPRERMNFGGEHIAAMTIIAKHIEAGTRRREQYGVARPRRTGGGAHGGLKRRRAFDRANPLQCPLDGRGILADQYCVPDLIPERRGERREILTLAL